MKKDIESANPFVHQRNLRLKVLKEMIQNKNITTERQVIRYCLAEYGVRLATAKDYLNALKSDDSIKLEE